MAGSTSLVMRRPKTFFKSASEPARSGKAPPATAHMNWKLLHHFESVRHRRDPRYSYKLDEDIAEYFKMVSNSHGGSNKLVSNGDSLTVVDCHPHSGDHALGTVLLSNDALGSICSFKHVLVRTKGRGCAAAVEYNLKRIGSVLASKWLKHDIQLRDESQKAVPPQTIDGSLTDSDKNYLKSIRGCGRPVRESRHGVLA